MDLRRSVAGVALVAYISLAVFALFSTHHHSVSMGGCPFMIGQESICQIDATAHLEAWKEMATTTFPIVTLLLLLSATVSLVFLWYLSPPRFGILKQRTNLLFSLLYQQLFSKGILHPKAP